MRNRPRKEENTLNAFTPSHIAELPTPSLILDLAKLEANIARMAARIGGLGGKLRPHVKTHKSIHVTRKIIEGGHVAGITVSTLREAEYFFEHGVTDIMYAVSVAPNKFEHAANLIKRGCDLKMVVDSQEMAALVAEDGRQRGLSYKLLIELDTDGHRSGAAPDGDDLLQIGRVLHDAPGTCLTGVMTHAGESYGCRTPEALLAIARQERDLTVAAAARLREAGMNVPVVSIGSTPTALAVDHLEGVTEVRAGVYSFFDLVMTGVGVCEPNDIAVSVLTSVIGRQQAKGWLITDAGWMAISRDRGTADQTIDYGFGMVLDVDGEPFGDLIVSGANQEHGIISSPSGETPLPSFEATKLLRVLPNHACATAAQHDKYYVVADNKVIAEWPRINRW